MSSSTGGFLGRSSTSNSNMRGLVQFIADLRNARARELEEKRINKELANIRQKFKGAWERCARVGSLEEAAVYHLAVSGRQLTPHFTLQMAASADTTRRNTCAR